MSAAWRAQIDAKLAEIDERLLTIAEGRRLLTRLDPLLFALVYMPHHLKGGESGEDITFSEFHLDLIKHATQWVVPSTQPAQHRDAYVAPRGAGKSSWLFTILPMWAAAHGHLKFIAAFADSAGQAELHLSTFKQELDNNALLREDYPELCTAARRQGGVNVSDRRSLYVAESGFAFSAKGIDSSSLGMKVGSDRPDMLILDDIEPDEGNYSAFQKDKRLGTVLNAILPLDLRARVVIVGTVTMPGSIIHDLVKSVTSSEEPAPWIADENITVHYYPALIVNDDGTERSLWPEKWSLEYLQSQRHTRSFRVNMQNDPMGYDGEYWNSEDFTHGELPDLTNQILSIDPAVTSKAKSDYTALAVIGYNRINQRCVVRGAWQVRLQPGDQLRAHIDRILKTFPETRAILVETNQGGETWRAILKPLGMKIVTKHQSEPKEVRAARLLNHYQRGRVVHERPMPTLEEQMISFPKGAHDDLVDAVGTGVEQFLQPQARVVKASMTAHDYVRTA